MRWRERGARALVAAVTPLLLASASGKAQALTVLAPNGGEKPLAGSVLTVRWTGEAAADHYDLFLAVGAPTSWKPVATGVRGTSFRWAVPVPAANIAKAWLKVRGVTAAGRQAGADISDAPFGIDVIDVKAPASNATLVGGTTSRISWRVVRTIRPVAKVRVLLSRDDGGTYAPIATLNAPGGVAPRFHDWPVATYPVTYAQCRVAVELRDGAGRLIGRDTSPGSFAIAPPTAMVSSRGVMKKGSVALNGVTYTAAPGAVLRRDDAFATEAELRDGMAVKIRGRRNDDGLTGVYARLEAEDEVQGRVSGLDAAAAPPRFTVLQQLVYTDDLTVFASFPAPGDVTAMLDDQFVEVHGQRDPAGAIRASRVELLAGPGGDDPHRPELKGLVGNLTATTFTIGVQQVDFSSAVIVPAGASLANGDPVEAEGTLAGGVLLASRVEREDIEDEPFEPVEGQKAEVEGYLRGLVDNLDGTFDFTVEGTAVATTAATVFVGGSPLDLAVGVKVEAEGHLTAGVLVPYRVEFRRARVRIEAVASAASASGVTLVGVAVGIDDLTRKDPAGLVPAVGTRYEARGYQDTLGAVVAEELRERGGGGAEILQGPASAFDATASTVTILGVVADVSGTLTGGVVFRNALEQVITREQFFSALQAGTVVKVKGDFAAGTIAAEEAELEN